MSDIDADIQLLKRALGRLDDAPLAALVRLARLARQAAQLQTENGWLRAENERMWAALADDVAEALLQQPLPPDVVEWARQIMKPLTAGGEVPPP